MCIRDRKPPTGTRPNIFTSPYQVWIKSVDVFWLQASAIQICFFAYFGPNFCDFPTKHIKGTSSHSHEPTFLIWTKSANALWLQVSAKSHASTYEIRKKIFFANFDLRFWSQIWRITHIIPQGHNSTRSCTIRENLKKIFFCLFWLAILGPNFAHWPWDLQKALVRIFLHLYT